MGAKQPFEAVVEAHGATVLRVCRAVLGRDEADDAWSDTFLSALKAYPSLPDDANVEAWLVTIAHRKAIDIVRARGRRAVTQPPQWEPIEGTQAGDSPDAPLDPELVRAIRSLPSRQRQSIAYHYVAGLPYKEVAAIVGGTPAAARRAAADGIATLRRRTGEPSKGESDDDQ